MNRRTEKLEALFEAALALESAAQQQAYLDRVCPGPDLRREVESLLAAHRNPDSLLVPGSAATAPHTGVPITEQPGGQIGRYKLLEKLGEGGFGVVYMAEQREPVKRRVALKIIKVGMDTREVVARFEAERQALALMDHPNIAKVFDGGVTGSQLTTDHGPLTAGSGRPYFVMELVRGIKITDYCDQNQLGLEERLKLVMQVCQAVQHAHQKGIIHRDLKPSNILVTLHDGVPVPKVIDFGIAKATQQELTEKTLFTQFHQFIGTPSYMSPEQAELSGLDIDTRSDIYSLGVLLYELLAGKPPFDGQELLRAGLDEMRRTLREVEPPKPSTRLKQERSATRAAGSGKSALRPPPSAIDADLDWIVMKCLEKDRTRRYETAAALATDIRRHLNSEPVAARPPSAGYRFVRFSRRHRGAMLGAAVVLATLVVGTLVSLWQAVEATRAKQLAERARTGEAAQRFTAEAERTNALRNAYAASLLLAQTDWDNNNLERFHRTLAETEAYPERGFEWFYWQRLGHLDRLTLRGHWDTITSVAISPDAHRAASGSSDHTARIWDTETGRELQLLEGHADYVWSVAFSPDGRRLATSSADQTARVWDSETGRLLFTLAGHVSGVPSIAFSPDGRWLATASKDRTVKVWDAATGLERLTLRGHAHEVWAVAFSGDGRLIASGGKDRAIKLWESNTGRERFTLTGHADWVSSLAFSVEGRLASSSGDRTVKVWDLGNRGELFALEGHRHIVASVAFSPDGQKIVTAALDGLVKLWDAADGRELGTLKGHMAAVQSAVFVPGGQRVVSGSWDRTVKIWDASDNTARGVLDGHKDKVVSLCFSPDGQRLASTGWDRGIKVWDVARCTTLHDWRGHADWVLALAFSPDGRRLVSGSSDRTAKVWDAGTGHELATFTGHEGSVKAVACSPEGRRVATASSDRTVRVWEISSGQERLTLRGHTEEVLTLAFAPDGQRLVSGSKDQTIKLWDAATGRELATLRGHRKPVEAVGWGRDNRLVSGSQDGEMKLWDAVSGREWLTLSGHADAVRSLTFSANGGRVVSGSADRTVRVWDTLSGRELLRLQDHANSVHSVALANDGLRLASGGGDRVIRVWEAAAAAQAGAWSKEAREAEAQAEQQRRERQAATARQRRGSKGLALISSWLLAGPFPVSARPLGGPGLDEAPLLAEAELQPRVGDPAGAAGGGILWREGAFPDGLIDFQQCFGAHSGCAAYAVAYLRAERAWDDLVLKIGSDDQARVWLNGKQVYEERSGREFEWDTDAAAGIQLRPGWNVIVLKVLNEAGEWKAALRLTDRQGNALAGLSTGLAPP